MIEKEKRWYINGEIPKEKIISKKNIKQVYANFNPDVRIRKINEDGKNTYTHTVKYFIDNNNREEIEQELSEDSYNNIFKFIDKQPINKDRYVVNIGNGLFAEVDKFLDTNDIIIEVEFPNDKSLSDFQKPYWFGNEVQEGKQFNKHVFSLINSKNIYDELIEKISWNSGVLDERI